MAKQQPLMDPEGQVIAPIHDAATAYAEARDARMAAGKVEQEAHDELLRVLKDNGYTPGDDDAYAAGGVTARIISETKTKVKVTVKEVAAPAPPPDPDPPAEPADLGEVQVEQEPSPEVH